jgi:hypothetical protein
MTEAETLDVQMMQETIRKLTLENDKWRIKFGELQTELAKETARRNVYSDVLESFVERLTNK